MLYCTPAGGTRQQKAEALRAEMEAKKRKTAAAAAERESTAKEGAGAAALDGAAPVGEGDYLVKDGDCISSIAKDTGHFWEKLWNDPGNAQLNKVREVPNLLLPGDRVTIPPLTLKHESGQTKMRHRFKRLGEPAHLNLTLKVDGVPIAGVQYSIVIDYGEELRGTTDTEGKIEQTP